MVDGDGRDDWMMSEWGDHDSSLLISIYSGFEWASTIVEDPKRLLHLVLWCMLFIGSNHFCNISTKYY